MVAYESLKTKEKSSWVIQTSRSGRLRELFIIINYKVLVTVQTGFPKGGGIYSWSLTRVVARRGSTESHLLASTCTR